MKFSSAFLLIIMTFCLMIGGPANSSVEEHANGIEGKLDGRVYSGQTGGVSSFTNKETDTLVFSNGRLRSTMCDRLGFSAGIYATTQRDGKTFFVAEIYSTTNGKIVWRGSIDNGSIEASFEWIKEGIFGKTEKNYWFKGDLKS